MSKAHITGDAFDLIAKLSGPQMQAAQFAALKRAGQTIQDEVSGHGIFKGRNRRVPKMKADEMKVGITISIVGGKRGFINRFINSGTVERRTKAGYSRGSVLGKKLVQEPDMERFAQEYNSFLADEINKL